MIISDDIVLKSWRRSDGKCECLGECGKHPGSCGKELTFTNRGKENGWGCWEVFSAGDASNGKPMNLSDCKALCWRCYKEWEKG